MYLLFKAPEQMNAATQTPKDKSSSSGYVFARESMGTGKEIRLVFDLAWWKYCDSVAAFSIAARRVPFLSCIDHTLLGLCIGLRS